MKQVFGGLLMGLGILIAGLSGLCTIFAAGSFLLDPASGEALTMLPAVFIFGGVPFVIGLGFFFGGRALLRSAGSPYAPPSPAQRVDPATMARPESDRTENDV